MQKLKLNSQSFEEAVSLVKAQCCNYYDSNCLLLDDGENHICHQLVTPGHIICRYFLESVLPGNKVLMKRIIDP